MEQNQLYNEIFFEKNDNYELEKSARKRLNIKAFQLSANYKYFWLEKAKIG